MGDASLQDRLRGHSTAFNGLLSLIPAKIYYGEDTSNQWQKTKQTKEEAAAARRGKLDPDSELNRNAKEVMDERAKNKRKRREMEEAEQEQDSDDEADEAGEGDSLVVDGVDVELPGQGLRKKSHEPNKKPKLDDEEKEEETQAQTNEVSLAGLSKKEQKRALKMQKRQEKKDQKKARKGDESQTPAQDKLPEETEQAGEKAMSKKEKKKAKKAAEAAAKETVAAEEEEKEEETVPEPVQEAPEATETSNELSLDPSLDFAGLQQMDEDPADSSMPDSEPQSPSFDTEPSNVNGTTTDSTTTSISSTIPPSEKPKHIKIPADTAALKDRLAAKIAALRAARKADGPDGKPIRTRQELIESRRFKEAQRKEHKKELRRLAKIEEERKREEALASNSPSIMSPAVELDDPASSNFTFGRVAFEDGAKLSRDLTYVLNNSKKKGPSDPKTALLKVQNAKKRLEDLDESKRKDVAEKEAWLSARRRLEGEKTRDDENLLKRAVKRKESAKKKSEKAWKERAKGVSEAQWGRQKKREENLKKRRDEKMLGKAGKKKKSKGGAGKKKGRPGFEGSLGVGGRKK